MDEKQRANLLTTNTLAADSVGIEYGIANLPQF